MTARYYFDQITSVIKKNYKYHIVNEEKTSVSNGNFNSSELIKNVFNKTPWSYLSFRINSNQLMPSFVFFTVTNVSTSVAVTWDPALLDNEASYRLVSQIVSEQTKRNDSSTLM